MEGPMQTCEHKLTKKLRTITRTNSTDIKIKALWQSRGGVEWINLISISF